MTNDVVNIEYYYEQGVKAYKEKKYELAANFFKKSVTKHTKMLNFQ